VPRRGDDRREGDRGSSAVICTEHLRAAEVGSRIDADGFVIGEVTALSRDRRSAASDLHKRNVSCSHGVVGVTFARITHYRVHPGAIESLLEEIVAVAPRWPVQPTNRQVEFFFINRSTGDSLSLVIGEDRSVSPAIELDRPSEGGSEYDVRLLQVGGPRESGVAPSLFGRVVRCDPGTVSELSFDGDSVPTSSAVWARGLLVAPSAQVVAFAVATDRVALDGSLQEFSARCAGVADYGEVAYHFWVDRDCEGDV
jgi:hypothetical protein